MNRIVLILLMSVPHLLNAQQYISLLKEDFNDNRHEWPFIKSDEKSTAEISAGIMKYQNKDNILHRTYVWVRTYPQMNVRYKLAVKYLDGPDNNRVGLRWASTTDNKFNEFGIAFNGNYVVRSFDKEEIKRREWTKVDMIDKNKFIELEVIKLGKDHFFKINGQLIYRTEIDTYYGDLVALMINGGATTAFDYLYIDEIRIDYNTMLKLKSSLEDELQKNIEKNIKGVVDDKPKKTVVAASTSSSTAKSNGISNAGDLYQGEHLKYLNKVRSQFKNKSVTHLIGSWKSPVHMSQGGHRIFYNYKLINGKQYYILFEIAEPHRKDKGLISNVNFSELLY